VAVDSVGILIADSGNSRIREVVAASGTIQTRAGNGTLGFSGDGGLATLAALNSPASVVVDISGNIFIADTGNNRIREVIADGRTINTVAGNGAAGFSGDGGPAINAELNFPNGVFLGPVSGDIFFADTGNSRIREVVADNIQTVVGNGTTGFIGDGGKPSSAELNGPMGVFVDGVGDVFIADTMNWRVREVVELMGNIQTVAGDGGVGFSGDGGPATSAELGFPAGVFADRFGNIFIADSDNFRVREMAATTGNIQTVAGIGSQGFSGDIGPATSAQLRQVFEISVDTSGNAFIADWSNGRIRKVVSRTGTISTVAGNDTSGFSGDGRPATNAALFGAFQAFVDSFGKYTSLILTTIAYGRWML